MLFLTYNENAHHLMRENVQAVDYSLDFYAMQTMQTYNGRRVMIGWMQNWKTVGSHLPKQGFMGQMSIVRELESCRRNKSLPGCDDDRQNLSTGHQRQIYRRDRDGSPRQ